MIYIIKNNTQFLSMDEIEINDIEEYMKTNHIKEIYLMAEPEKSCRGGSAPVAAKVQNYTTHEKKS
jgi:hypothetical protein